MTFLNESSVCYFLRLVDIFTDFVKEKKRKDKSGGRGKDSSLVPTVKTTSWDLWGYFSGLTS